jgi:GST-like protein
MIDPTVFPVARKWPTRFPDRIQLYSLTTPNGVKVSIMLEETGLAYEPHLVSFATSDHKTPEFASLSPYKKIPAIIDPNGPGNRPLPMFESGAILLYLAEKSGKLMHADKFDYYEVLQWVMFQMSFIGPMFGQVGFFNKFACRLFKDKRSLNHYVDQSKSLLALLDERLESRAWMMGDDYTIVDISVFPWVRNLIGYYKAADLVGISNFPNVMRALDAFLARPAVARGLKIPAAD